MRPHQNKYDLVIGSAQWFTAFIIYTHIYIVTSFHLAVQNSLKNNMSSHGQGCHLQQQKATSINQRRSYFRLFVQYWAYEKRKSEILRKPKILIKIWNSQRRKGNFDKRISEILRKSENSPHQKSEISHPHGEHKIVTISHRVSHRSLQVWM